MKREQRLPELLAPAGDFDCLTAAILGGADAVYIGGLRFGARAFAKNFSNDELQRAVILCHSFGVRLYLTLNTLVLDKELDDALEFARFADSIGVDALIIADLGLAALIRREIPSLELHASTQMGIHNSLGAEFAYKLGCKRVVLARECSYEDMCKITERTSAECEVFVHGALCVCHSGQCLFSSMVGGRSGNRGECAQPCRLPYDGGKYILSLSDLSLANHVRELIDSGVSSLKIEGRMKSPLYVYEVTKIYRALLDEQRCANSSESARLADVFSRGGFTDGYFVGRTDKGMTGVRSETDKAQTKNIEAEKLSLPRLKISASAEFSLGVPSRLTLHAKITPRWQSASNIRDIYLSADAEGANPAEAENAPLSIDGLRSRLAKMGNTPFDLAPLSIEVSVGDGINLPPSSVNALRRSCAEELEKKLCRPLDELLEIERSLPYDKISSSRSGVLKAEKKSGELRSALFFSADALLDAAREGKSSINGLDIRYVSLFDFTRVNSEIPGAANGIYLPPVIMENEIEGVKAELSSILGGTPKWILAGNISHLELLSSIEKNFKVYADFRLNCFNSKSFELLLSAGADSVILSPELTLPQARDIGGSVITMGRIPLMLTERCFIKENFGCERCSRAAIKDRKGARFPIMREREHRNIIFNSSITYMGDKLSELYSVGIDRHHFIFSAESGREILGLIKSYREGKPISADVRRIGRR